MAHILKALVGESSTTTGTGAFTLDAALTDHRRFSDVCSVADTVEYVIRHATDGSWEAGIGTYSSANTLTRTTVFESSTGTAISFAAGNKSVIITPLASGLGRSDYMESKTTPVDADSVALSDSAASGFRKKLTWANLKATLKTYFDSLYAATLGADDNYVTDAEKVKLTNLSGTNSGDNATNSQYSGLVSNATHTGDATGSTALTVVALNGTSLAGLATGLLKNTTSTGVPSIATAGTDYALPSQTFYIGTTSVAINRASAALTLAGITLTTPVLSNPSFSGTTANMGTVTTIDINGGTADGMTMGASAALARVNTDRLETTRTAVTAPASTDGNIFSGTYTPSLTPVTNIGSSAAVSCQYMRVGNVVSVSGHVYLGPAATGPALIGVTLPIPSNFTIPSQLGGTFAASGVDENPGSIYADTANDLAVFDIQAKQTAVAAYTFHFTYVVL